MKENKEVLLYACLDAIDKEPLPPYILSDDSWDDMRADRQAVAHRIRWAVERAKASIRNRIIKRAYPEDPVIYRIYNDWDVHYDRYEMPCLTYGANRERDIVRTAIYCQILCSDFYGHEYMLSTQGVNFILREFYGFVAIRSEDTFQLVQEIDISTERDSVAEHYAIVSDVVGEIRRDETLVLFDSPVLQEEMRPYVFRYNNPPLYRYSEPCYGETRRGS